MWQIIGAGAIGCLWAANLMRTGQQVQLITRKKSSVQQLTYVNLAGEKNVYDCPISPQLNDSLSPILICVKAPQVEQALLQHIDAISEQQVIILMHNGMGCAEQVAEILPNNPIICATTANGCLLHSPLNIQQTGLGITYLGPFNAPAKAFSGLATQFNRALNNSHWCTDIEQKLWLKLMINIAINPLTAIYQIPNGRLAEQQFQVQIDKMVAEAMPLLHKLDLGFEEMALRQVVNNVINATANNFSSMNRDIHFQRRTENDFISGYFLQKAAKYEVETPVIKSLSMQIKVMENHSLVRSSIGSC